VFQILSRQGLLAIVALFAMPLHAEQISLICDVKFVGMGSEDVIIQVDTDAKGVYFQDEEVMKYKVTPEALDFILKCKPEAGKKGCINTHVTVNRYSGRLSTVFSLNLLKGQSPDYEGTCSVLPAKKF
jgi:hypothetical protein